MFFFSSSLLQFGVFCYVHIFAIFDETKNAAKELKFSFLKTLLWWNYFGLIWISYNTLCIKICLKAPEKGRFTLLVAEQTLHIKNRIKQLAIFTFSPVMSCEWQPTKKWW